MLDVNLPALPVLAEIAITDDPNDTNSVEINVIAADVTRPLLLLPAPHRVGAALWLETITVGLDDRMTVGFDDRVTVPDDMVVAMALWFEAMTTGAEFAMVA